MDNEVDNEYEPESELSLVTTEELVEELLNRSDAGVICLFRDRDEERTSTDAFMCGHPLFCIGLMESYKQHILKEYETTETDRIE
jgi:hypothetical protein